MNPTGDHEGVPAAEGAREPGPDLRGAIQRSLWSSALGLGAALLVGLLVVRAGVHEGALRDLASRARGDLLGLGLGGVALGFGFMAVSWRALLPPGSRASVPGLTAMLLAGLLLTYAVPGPVAELGASWFVHRRYRVSLADAVASAAASRVVGLATAALLALLSWAVFDLPVSERYRVAVAASALLVGLGGALLAALAAAPLVWQRLASRVLGALHRLRALRGPAERVERAVVSLTEALARVVARGRAPYARALGADTLAHAAMVAGIASVGAALGVPLDPGGLLFAYALSIAGGVVLTALPGSQITRDAAFVTLLVGACGVSAAEGVAVAAVVRLLQVLLQGAGGLAVGGLLLSRGAQEPGRAQ